MTEIIHVQRTLTQQEKADEAEQMAELLNEIDELENSKKDHAAMIKEEIAAKTLKLKQAGSRVRSGYALEEHECDIVRDPEKQMIRYVDIDTRELVKERPMTEDELQLELEEA